MGENILHVKCSFCGKDIECPEELTKSSDKHACVDCFSNPKLKISEEDAGRIHVDIPPERLGEVLDKVVMSLGSEAFPPIWKDNKRMIENMPKKEAAQFMFEMGASVMLDVMMQQDGHVILEEDADGNARRRF